MFSFFFGFVLFLFFSQIRGCQIDFVESYSGRFFQFETKDGCNYRLLQIAILIALGERQTKTSICTFSSLRGFFLTCPWK